MNKNKSFLTLAFSGFKFGLFITLIFSFFLMITYGVGLHTPNEILSGTFLGNYIFSGNVNLSSSNIIGLTLGEPIPKGVVITFALLNCPSGWLKTNGSNISRSTYSLLFSVINTTYGIGDGNTTFSLPDFRGIFIRGLDDGRGIDSGRTLNSLQEGTGIMGWPVDYSQWLQMINPDGTYGSFTTHRPRSENALTDNQAYRRMRPRNMALLYCIKY